MNRCSPPSSSISSAPGRKCRWYVLPSRIVVPSSRRRTGSRALTVAFVPTGMNAGVGTSPCAVRRTPARAAPSVAVTVKLTTRFRASLGSIRAPRVRFSALPSKAGGGTGCPGYTRGLRSQEEHRIAEGVEAVPLLDREPVEAPRLLDAREGHDQREQGRARQMEVRH